MVKPLAPCMDCSDRHIGCHGICNRYKAYTIQKHTRNLKRVFDNRNLCIIL
nr:MAG TPA: hypothetical protein [Bacteriophage sp.]